MYTFVVKLSLYSFLTRGYLLNLADNFARNFMLSASDWSTKFLRCKWNVCRKEFAYLITKMLKSQVPKTQLKGCVQVLRALRTDDSSLYRLAC